MNRKSHYVFLGAGVTLLAVLGAFVFLLTPTQADNAFPASVSQPQKEAILAVASGKESVEAKTEETDITFAPEQADNNPQTDKPLSTPVSEEGEFVPELSTVENPETDLDQISHQISTLVAKNESALLGKPGWFYEKHENYAPLKYASNTGDIYGIPVTTLLGTDTTTHEEWYGVDPQGYFEQKIGRSIDANGITRTRWAITNGYFVTLEFVGVTEFAISPQPEARQKAPLGDGFDDYLAMFQGAGAKVIAWYDNDLYIVTMTTMYDEPYTNILGELVSSDQTKYGFNLDTGAIQLFEVTYQTSDSDGEWIVLERSVLLEQRLVESLPAEVAQALQQASALTEGN